MLVKYDTCSRADRKTGLGSEEEWKSSASAGACMKETELFLEARGLLDSGPGGGKSGQMNGEANWVVGGCCSAVLNAAMAEWWRCCMRPRGLVLGTWTAALFMVHKVFMVSVEVKNEVG